MSEYRIQGATGEWEVVIGLEVHAQVTSNAKLFSGAATAFGADDVGKGGVVEPRGIEPLTSAVRLQRSPI